MSEFNPALRPWSAPAPSQRGGAGSYERMDAIDNIVWQTRAAPPTDYEGQLADALMAAFEDGAQDPAGVAARLNARRVHGPDGAPWTEATLAAELKRLGV